MQITDQVISEFQYPFDPSRFQRYDANPKKLKEFAMVNNIKW